MGPPGNAPVVELAGEGADGGAATAATAAQPSRPPCGGRPRLVGLDVLRGLTMAVMLVVDYAGACYPAIDHAPWDGIHLADFVMPFFLWVSGVSMSISLRVRPGELRYTVFARAARRAVRLFLLGIVVQGRWFSLERGVPVLHLDLSTVRWLGILQRIALAFLLLAAAELLPPAARGRAAAAAAGGEQLLRASGVSETAARHNFCGISLFKARTSQWGVALAAFALGAVLTYRVRPPSSWPGCAPGVYSCGGGPAEGCTGQEDELQLKHMGCSAVGYLDSHVLGIGHMYVRGSGTPSWPPTWGFDPEGLVTTASAVLPMAFGLHSGFVWRTLRDARAVLLHWLVLGLVLTTFASVLSLWVPFNKRLWSPSYSLLMCGLATLVYAGLFLVVDVGTGLAESLQRLRRGAKVVLSPLQWLGENCILFFVLSDCSGGLDWFLRSLTWGQPSAEDNVVSWFQNTVLMQRFGLGASCAGGYEQCGPAVMAFVWIEVLFWMVVCGLLHYKGIFWKI